MPRRCTSPTAFFDAYTIAFGIRNVTDIPTGAGARRTACCSCGGRFFCLEFSTTRVAGLRARSTTPIRTSSCPSSASCSADDEDSYRYLIESIRRFPDMPDVRGDDPRRPASSRPGSSRSSAGWSRSIQRLEDLTADDRHRHPSLAAAQMGPHARAPRRAARDRARSATRRRRSAGWSRIARFGARVPAMPRYADAFQAIGPAAIKLGQTLATRPDLVGEEAAHDLLRLQDALPPVPFADDPRARSSAASAAPLETLFASDRRRCRSAPPRSRRSTARSPPTAARSRSRCCAPASRSEFAREIDTYEWAAAQLEALGGEAARLRPRLVIATFKRWTAARARPAARGRLGLRTRRGDDRPSPTSSSPRSTGSAPPAGC